MDPIKREEIRGLFTLSLLALLLVIKMNWDTFGIEPSIWIRIPFTNVLTRFDLLFFIDMITFCWIAYAFLMILHFSDDLIISRRKRNFLRRLGLSFLIVGPLGVAVIFLILVGGAFVIQYPHVIYVILVLLVSIIIVNLILRKYEVSIVVEPKKKEKKA